MKESEAFGSCVIEKPRVVWPGNASGIHGKILDASIKEFDLKLPLTVGGFNDPNLIKESCDEGMYPSLGGSS